MDSKFLTFSLRSEDIYSNNYIRIAAILRIILSYCLVAVLSISVIALASKWLETTRLTAVMSVGLLLSLILLNRGWIRLTSWLSLSIFLAGSFYSTYIGDGLHDLSMVSLPGILVIAALLLNRKLFILFSLLTISSPVVLVLVKQITRQPVWHPDDVWSELLLLILILTVISIGIRILINHILNSLNRLHESEQKYRNFYTNIQDIYLEISLNGRILEISHRAEELLGYPVWELVGRPVQDFYAQPEKHNGFMADIMRESRLENYEVQLKDKMENQHIVSINASLALDENGKPVKIVGSMRDISEKKNLEQQLFQVQKLESIGTLAGGIAHDFNNLLTVINGHCELALNNVGDRDPVTTGDIKAIKSAADRAADLTRQLLMFSKKQEGSPVVINPNTIILNMQKMFSRLLGEDIKIRYRLDEHIAGILSDPVQFEQVLLNLMINARDAFPGHSWKEAEKEICIATNMLSEDDSGRQIQIVIRDNGAGMDQAVQERIFEPFFTTKENGTGLGLSTVYGIVRQNNANISVSSEVGVGTTFTILWPECDSRMDKNHVRHDEQTFQGTEHILLVEDDPSVRVITAQALRLHGYSVEEAGDGAAALNYFTHTQKHVDLLLTDMILPGINGPDLYRKLKKQDGGLKVLFISGYANTEILDRLEPEERENFVHKPFGISDLLRNIRRVLEKMEAAGSKQLSGARNAELGAPGSEFQVPG